MIEFLDETTISDSVVGAVFELQERTDLVRDIAAVLAMAEDHLLYDYDPARRAEHETVRRLVAIRELRRLLSDIGNPTGEVLDLTPLIDQLPAE